MRIGREAMGTELADFLRRQIRQTGPMTVAEWMALCLGHPRHGYYMTRDPLGAAGDFTTAPEISQMFGELLGLWAAQCWLQSGQPDPVHLVELGPGRGTLMADALRATRRVPGFHQALRVHLVETSHTLRERQRQTLAGVEVTWHDRLAEVPAGPLLLLANEFIDALPIRQFERTTRGWAERKVGLDEEDSFTFLLDPRPGDTLVPPALRNADIGAVVEICPAGQAVAREAGERLAAHGGAALFIDYGYAGPSAGDTLQAMRGHAYAPLLEAPGEADLTAHVDFTALAEAARAGGAKSWGPVEQGSLLQSLGIAHRAASLKRVAAPDQADGIDAALDRLTGDAGMGRLFKALAVTGPDTSAPAGFE
ncbi:class I SAM-dependent methyltransferase [Indioceanicola profundi]|uniref:class I SAM-dependent methyltransferase n=1 Tax=Indioceanicola profundi TaxID=2220096 RepID=UPI000E6ACB8A|nr:class I SAM-dependent methyltransferase [Indioceanicola profundi]